MNFSLGKHFMLCMSKHLLIHFVGEFHHVRDDIIFDEALNANNGDYSSTVGGQSHREGAQNIIKMGGTNYIITG